MKTPKVSVIMPVYNAAQYLKQTIDSILCQSYTNFEFIIIDDGSNDSSYDIIKSYNDPRIKALKNDYNIGYVRSLNKLIKMSIGEYIARQDNDDISFPDRIEKQVNFLNNNPKIGLCGCNMLTFGKYKRKTLMPIFDDEIRSYMLIDNPFCHPTVMMRHSLLLQLPIIYDESLCPAEDYDLWFRMSMFTKFANLSDSLLYYRVHENSTSLLRRKIQIEKANIIRRKIYETTLSIILSEDEIELLSCLSNPQFLFIEQLGKLEKLISEILKKNQATKYFKQQILKKMFFYFWIKAIYRTRNISRKNKLKIILFSNLYHYTGVQNLVTKRILKKLIYDKYI